MRLLSESQDYIHGGTQKNEYTPADVIAVPCPLCGSQDRQQLYTEHAVIGVVRCRGCSLIYTSPRLKEPEKVYWGDEDLYYSEARLIFEGKARHHRDPNYLEEILEIERHAPKGRLLDVGCNMGRLLALAKSRGWSAHGVEPSPTLSKLARKWDIEVHNCFLHEIPEGENGTFDVVAFSDVFEHITEPKAFLEQAKRLMKPGGLLYVKVPNALWSLLKQRLLGWAGRQPKQGLWDAYEHVVHYTDGTLTRMLEGADLHVISLTTARPVQTPNWHEHVGHYYQYPTPPLMDFGRKAVRSSFHAVSGLERALRLGKLGYFAQSIVVVARLRRHTSAT